MNNSNLLKNSNHNLFVTVVSRIEYRFRVTGLKLLPNWKTPQQIKQSQALSQLKQFVFRLQ